MSELFPGQGNETTNPNAVLVPPQIQAARFGSLSSSENPTKLGDAVKGIILGAAVFIIFVASQLGFEIGTEQITAFAINAGAAISFLVTVYGLVKKLVVAITAKW